MEGSKTGRNHESVMQYQDWLNKYWTLSAKPAQKAQGSTANKRMRSGTSPPSRQQEYAKYQKQFAEFAKRNAACKKKTQFNQKQTYECYEHDVNELLLSGHDPYEPMLSGHDPYEPMLSGHDPYEPMLSGHNANMQQNFQSMNQELRIQLREAITRAQLHERK